MILSEKGVTVEELSAFLGTTTNNVAEYQALLLTLRRAAELGFQRVQVLMDSELIVRQLNGLYKVKDPKMRELHSQVQRVLRQFSEWHIRHVPRSENKRADELVNAILDARDQSIREAQL